ncbi:MAG: tetratricopeptide repeat protein [Gemmatimonadales bacterium]
MSRLALAVTLLLVPLRAVTGQEQTAELLRRARELYERVDIERALPLLRQVVSPAWPDEMTPGQRVEAYRYLGASLALVGQADSAAFYFRNALERDPFTDLDRRQFTPAQLAAFDVARRRSFGVGVRPVAAARVDPRIERVTFSVVSTHAAVLRGEVRPAVGPAPEERRVVVFTGDNDGPREIGWDGLAAGGRLALPGRYELVITGRSRLETRTDSARVYFEIRHEVTPLEDTLPDLGRDDLLPERSTTSAATGDLLKGLGVAAGVWLIADGLAAEALNGGDGGGGRSAAVMLGASFTGVVAFVTGRRPRDLPDNVAANERRRAERRAANDAIARRNADLIAQTILVITPAAGVGP